MIKQGQRKRKEKKKERKKKNYNVILIYMYIVCENKLIFLFKLNALNSTKIQHVMLIVLICACLCLNNFGPAMHQKLQL